MKKILMLTAFALAGLAAAQDTTTPAPAPADTTPVTAPADTTPAPADTTPAPTDTTPTDTTAPADTTAPTNAAPADTAPAPADTTAPAPATTAAPAPMQNNMAMPAMSPADNFSKAQEFAVQADVAYPVPFYDRTLWKAAVNYSYSAAKGDATNRDYNAYLAQLYTKTQWWINAYNAWSNLGDLNATEKQWASLSAAKLAYLALQRGDKAAASAYVAKGMAWADSPSLQSIKKRL